MPPRDLPRLVFVTRKTRLVQLQEARGTLGQVAFFLASQGQALDPYVAEDTQQQAALQQIMATLPLQQRRAAIDRADLSRFLFAPDDVVVVVGQDGLVANAAKYLQGQIVIGLNPDPARYDGVLCPHIPAQLPHLLRHLQQAQLPGLQLETRTLVQATLEDGQQLCGLNEIFVGHRSHQSARYQLITPSGQERQSSSGLICATGTGSTGWALSLARQCHCEIPLPEPQEARLSWFVREAFPSRTTGISLTQGVLTQDQQLQVSSEMPEDGVIFADGIETDYLTFAAGQTVTLSLAPQRLHLLMPVR